MRVAGHIAGLALAATPPGALFLAQSWLVATGQTDAVLSLAKYAGLLGLIFFAFDGSSGLIPAMLRLRHSDAVMRSAYLVYRAGIAALGLAMIPIALHFAPADTATLLPFLTTALLLRFPLLDAELDRRGFQHWAMLLQNGWMLPLCFGAVLNPEISAETAGHAAFWSTVVLATAHVFLAGPYQRSTKANFGAALIEIVTVMGAQGIGQLYGRAVLFVLGASFSGPLPALIIYAKQAFNAAGLLVTYLRRVELARRRPSMGLSLTGQAAIALVSSILVALAAPMLGLPHGFVLVLIAWQSLEKLSATAVYDFQLQNRHRLALAGLCNTCVLGLAGLALALGKTAPILFVTLETLGYCVVLLLWFATNRSRRAAERAARP
ncbi:hypothetical protein [Devosia sp.]|uniref:hypothetical protein n=1 Tax=Devosia sp. TaxID=1871048 RepID=UPI001B28211C|nr:hypothetical protein [Devosia sp.]MBO9589018.1 hypothetical protein [Devosia sp.]